MFWRIALTAALLSGAAMADEMESTVGDKDEGREQGKYLRSVDDMDVRNVDGSKIGEIEDVLVDENGIPVAFVLEIGGFMGLADAEPIVPIEALTYSDGHYVSKMSQEQLENMPYWEDDR